jgi:hypothetical protein
MKELNLEVRERAAWGSTGGHGVIPILLDLSVLTNPSFFVLLSGKQDGIR